MFPHFITSSLRHKTKFWDFFSILEKFKQTCHVPMLKLKCPGWKFVGKVRSSWNFYWVLYGIVGWCYDLMNVRMKIVGPDMNLFDEILFKIQNFFPTIFYPRQKDQWGISSRVWIYYVPNLSYGDNKICTFVILDQSFANVKQVYSSVLRLNKW